MSTVFKMGHAKFQIGCHKKLTFQRFKKIFKKSSRQFYFLCTFHDAISRVSIQPC